MRVRIRSFWSKRSRGVLIVLVAVILCVGVGVTVAGATRSSSSDSTRSEKYVDRTRELQLALGKSVTVVPARGTTNVPLDAHVYVGTDAGYLTSVKVVAADGSSVPGTKVGSKWATTGSLEPNTAYRVVVTLAGSDGITAATSSTFTTLSPAATIGATIWPDGNLVVGVAQPIVVKFDQPIDSPEARASVISRFAITTTPAVTLRYHWFSSKELHFRPAEFWPTGTKIAVFADLGSWNAGDGRWGAGQPSAHFIIGNSHVATANLATHTMTVTENGRTLATYPMSGGRPKYPTMNGTHIVLDRESVVHMTSASNGIPVNSPDGYDELVYDDVHISDSGEYVHAAPWSVSSQGVDNVSHGCINLSPANAKVFMDFSRIGDVVQVVGGPRPPDLGDHGVMDWDTPWAQWTAIPPAPSTPSTPSAVSAHPVAVVR